MLLFLLLHNRLEQYLNKKLSCLTEGALVPCSLVDIFTK